MFPSIILEVYYMKNKKSGKRSENIMVKKKKKEKLKNHLHWDSIPGLLRGSPPCIPLDHLSCLAVVRIFSNYII